jgi:hypothetical protein
LFDTHGNGANSATLQNRPTQAKAQQPQGKGSLVITRLGHYNCLILPPFLGLNHIVFSMKIKIRTSIENYTMFERD